MISTDLWEDEHFARLSDKAKLLFIACISSADDEGRLSGNPANLRAMAFRFENVGIKKIEWLVGEISEALKNFKIYEVNGCKYIQLEKWLSYQTIRQDREKSSRFPKWQPNGNQKTAQPNLTKPNLTKPIIERVLSYLNNKTKKNFHLTKTNQTQIAARLAEKYTEEDLKKVIDIKAEDPYFKENPKYMNPVTLFRKSKFDNYLNEKITKVIQKEYVVPTKKPEYKPIPKESKEKIRHLTKGIGKGVK